MSPMSRPSATKAMLSAAASRGCSARRSARNAKAAATFGAQSARLGPTPLVLTEPLDAASNLTNPQAMAGRVAVTMRGGCEFVDKALRVQQA